MIPVAMSEIYPQSEGGSGAKGSLIRRFIPVSLRTQIRQLVAPLTFPRAVKTMQGVIERIRPDLIHAMRIPFEGMIAAMSMRGSEKGRGNAVKAPLLVSVWGNDFTLHAKSSTRMANYTRQVLNVCNALHTDCVRDLNLARKLGFAVMKPSMVLPGGGGVKLDIFHPPQDEFDDERYLPIDEQQRVTIINPRGFRAYVRNDTFFNAIPLVVYRHPLVRFLCPNMAGEAQAERWIAKLGIGEHVELLPPQSRQQMADLFRQSQISLSITTHDGTPNTLLEAMACGCFPIAGDIESLHEWITPEVNGLLVDPGDPKALAEAMLSIISRPDLRRQARERNIQLIEERGEYGKTMRAAENFYTSMVKA